MKKIALFLSSAAALFMATGCDEKIDSVSEIANDAVKFNFTITSPAPETKAAKTGWAAGDKLNVWFDSNKQETPDLVLTYDGTQWNSGSLREGVKAGLLASGGKIWMVYEGYNDLSKYSFSSNNFEPENEYKNIATAPWNSSTSKYVSACPLIVITDGETYTFADNTITATIDSWYFMTKFKVLVKNYGAALDPGSHSYYLQVQKGTGGESGKYADALGGFVIGSRQSTMSNYTGFARGVTEADGLAFYYGYLTASAEDITFNLYNDVDASPMCSYTVANKTVSFNSNTSCQGVAIDYSKFTAVP